MKKLFSDHKPEIFSAIVAVLAITLVAFLPAYRGWKLDSNNAAQFGDFIGGYFGTVFLIVSVALLFGSYRNQRATNERAAFEGRFFELLKFHRENLAEIDIGEKRGRSVFVSLIREFRQTLKLVQEEINARPPARASIDKLDLAYRAFYYGVGFNSSRILRDSLQAEYDSDLVNRVIKKMESVQSDYRDHARNLENTSGSEVYRNQAKQAIEKMTRLSYCPFDGHQSRLGHYYRHLFHTVRFAATHAPEGKAEEYVDLLRAQLTNHEQALFCLNALSRIGVAWQRLGYLDQFAMIKNLPKHFFDPVGELDVEKRFPKISFEYSKTDGSRAEPNTDTSD